MEMLTRKRRQKYWSWNRDWGGGAVTAGRKRSLRRCRVIRTVGRVSVIMVTVATLLMK